MDDYHNISKQENREIIDLQHRVHALEQKPDVVFLRTLMERVEALESQVKHLQSNENPIGGPWG